MPLGMRNGAIVVNRGGGVAYPHQVWVAIDDGRKLATYGLNSSSRPAPRFAWVKENGIFIKGKYGRPVAEGEPDNPASVYSGNPTQASDLTIADFRDDFDDNSLSEQWTVGGVGTGTVVETNQELQITASFDVGGGTSERVEVTFEAYSGDFSIELPTALQSYGGSYGTNGYRGATLAIYDASETQIARALSYHYRSGTGATNHYFNGEIVGVGENSVQIVGDTSILRIRRVGSTMYCDYNVSGWVNLFSGTKTTAVSTVRIEAGTARLTANSRSDFDSITVSTSGA